MVGHQTLNLAIGVRVPASQPTRLALVLKLKAAITKWLPRFFGPFYLRANLWRSVLEIKLDRQLQLPGRVD